MSLVTAGPTGARERQSGISSSIPTGFITAPERTWPPSSADFSTTVIASSGDFCLSRMAAASPDGPAPTMTTSVSRISRVPASANRRSMRWRVKAGCDITGFMSVDRPLNVAEMTAALDWYRAVGVDVAVGEEAVDRFAASAAAPRRSAPMPPPRQQSPR